MERKDTPKSWYASNSGDQGIIASENTGETIAIAYDKDNAPILAAAPALLRELKRCQEVLFAYVHTDEFPEMCAFAEAEIGASLAIEQATE